MAKRKYQKRAGPVWDTNAVVFQELYGFRGFESGVCQPKFGAAVHLPLVVSGFDRQSLVVEGGALRVEVEEGTEMVPPTLVNLAYHFGYMKWATELVFQMMRAKIRPGELPEDFFDAVSLHAKTKLNAELINPHRQALLQCSSPLYLYCVPVEAYRTDEVTGELVVSRAKEDEVLCVLPKSPRVAEHYGLAPEEMRLLAPQVAYVVRSRCSHHAIKSPRMLLLEMQGWSEYLPRRLLDAFFEYIGSRHPDLLPKAEQRKQLLKAGLREV